MKRLYKRLASSMLTFVLLLSSLLPGIPVSLAADDSITLVQVQVILATDNDGNNFTNVGDIVQVQVVLNNTDGGCGAASTQVTANMTAYGGGPAVNLNCVADNGGAGDVFDLGFPVVNAAGAGIDVPANNAASQIQIVANDADENGGAGNPNPNQNTNPLGDGVIDTTATNGVDTQAVVITNANITSSLSVDLNTIGVGDVNDVIRTIWDNSAGGDNNADVIPANVFADLSPFGGSATQQLFDDGSNGDVTGADNIYTYDHTISVGSVNASNLNASVGAQDDAQNNTGPVIDDSNLVVNNATGSSRRRRVEESPLLVSDEEATEDILASCNCTEEKQTLDTVSFDLYDSYISSDHLLCLNPGCFDSPVIEPKSPTEEFLIEATHERKTASKKLRDAMDKESKAAKNVKDKEIKAGQANFDFAGVTINGRKAGETQSEYDARRKESALKRQRAYDDLRNAQRDHEHAQQERRKASREFDKAKEKWNDAYKATVEEFGVEKASEMHRKADETPEFGGSCVDPGCDTGSAEIIEAQISFDEAVGEYNSCLEQCSVQEELQYTPWTAADEIFDEEDDSIGSEAQDEFVDAFDDSNAGETLEEFLRYFESDISPKDLGPFESPSGVEHYIPSEAFATDISGHPDEAFLLELYHIGAVKGKGESKEFAPNETMTRAALLKVALEVFGYEVPNTVRKKPFIDVDLEQWHARYFDAGARNKILLGYGDQDLPQEERQAIPWQEVSLIETLAIFTRSAEIDVSVAEDYQSAYVDENNPQWWDNIWKWSEMNGLVNTEQLSYQEKTDEEVEGEETKDHQEGEEANPGYTISIIYPKDDPESLIQRHGLALAIKILALKNKEPCNCDKEKAAWDAAEKDAVEKQEAANDAEETAQSSEKIAQKAESKAKEAQQAVDDLAKYDDDSSSATGEDDVTITTGDLRLMELAKAEIDQQVANGDKSLEDGQKEKESINKDKLPELRARRDALLALARAQRDAADKAAKEARTKADTDRAKADKAQKDADDAKKAVETAKKAYEECVEKCKIIKEKVAAEKKRLEAERKKRALAAARAKAAAKAKAEAKARAEAKAEADRQAREDAEQARRDAEEARNSESQEATGEIPNASKDPCKEKLAQAISTHAQNTAKIYPDYASEIGSVPGAREARTVATGIGAAIKAATKVAYQGGSSALQVAKAATAAIPAVYKLWVDYVGDKIKGAGKRIIANRRYCEYIKHATTGKCGYEVFRNTQGDPVKTVYWEKGADGKYHVIIMGPKDEVQEGVCE